MTHRTDYTITKCGNSLTVWKNSKVASKGFTDNESALHSIWGLEGKNQNDFYVVHDGIVARVERDTL